MDHNRDAATPASQHICDAIPFPVRYTLVSERGSVGSVADTDVVQRLRTVLERTGWTPYELSTRAGLSGSHIANILQRGAKRLGADTLRAIAQAAGVSERWMVLGEGAPDSDDQAPQPETLSATWSAIPGWTEAEAQVRRDHPEWADETKWGAARSAAPFMAPAGGVQPIHVEELYRLAVRLGAGGDLRAQVDAQAAKVRAEVQAIQEGTMAPRRPPPEKPARRARR